MSNRRGVRRTTIGLRIVVGTLLVLAANLLLNLASALPSESWLSAHRVWIIGGLVVIVVLGIVVDVAFGLRGDEAGRRSPTTEEVLAALRRAEWRLQVSATEKRSGRLSLVVPQNRVGLHVSLRRLEIARGGERLVESPVPLSCEATELPEVFAEKLNSQLVLIGRPGAGKTVCALQIVDHFNRPDVDEGSPLMVMLNLSGWPVWHAQQIGEGERPTMEQWIADQIVQRHDLVPEEALAAASDPRLVPIFDGLDEVPPDTDDFFGRSTCVQQLNEFIRHRPHFVVCCRAEEYLEMAPRLVGNHSQAIMSIEPLAPENVARYLEMRGHKWTTLVERLRTGTPTEQDAVARSILDRPLYVALALDVFDRTDPVGLPLDSTMSATDHLWRHFLQSRDSSRRAQQPIERWLQTIAHLMHDANSTSFWMHQVTIPTSTVFEV